MSAQPSSPPSGFLYSLAATPLARLELVPTRNLLLLAGAAFFLTFGQSAQNAVGNNFQVETLKMTAFDRGLMETGREIPGLFLVLISAALVAIPVARLTAFCVAMLALQYLGFFFVQDIWQAIGLVVFGSIGFHMWAPLQRELNMSLADKSRSGTILGLMAGIGSAGGLLGMVTVWIFAPSLGYRMMFLWAAVGLVIASLLVSRVRSPRAPEHEKPARFVLRRRYSFYYLLNFLEGATRQVWGAFALFTLVTIYHIDVRTVTLMLMLNSLLTMFMNPRIGAWVDQWGERRAMMLGYAGVALIFTAFALNNVAWVAIAIYFTYQTTFNFTFLSVPSYLNKIARPGDLSPSLAMGITAEHVAGVFIPTIGGYFWVTYGYTYAFLIGAAVSAICFLAVTRLPRGRLVEEEPAGVH